MDVRWIQGKALYWKQKRADKVWNKKQNALRKLTSNLAKGSQAAAGLSEAATWAMSADALKVEVRKYKNQMRGILPRLFSAQAAAFRLSTAVPSQIDPLVQRLITLHRELGNASALAYPDEALQKLKSFVGPAHQLTQDVLDVDVDICMRSQSRGDREGAVPGPDSPVYKEFWNRLNFEHELLNRRLTWLLTSQTILFAAYGFTVTKAPDTGGKVTGKDPLVQNFHEVIAWSGMIAAILMLIGILAGLNAKRAVWRDYQKYYDPRQKWGVRTGATLAGLVPDVFTPVVFAVAWLVVLVCSP